MEARLDKRSSIGIHMLCAGSVSNQPLANQQTISTNPLRLLSERKAGDSLKRKAC